MQSNQVQWKVSLPFQLKTFCDSMITYTEVKGPFKSQTSASIVWVFICQLSKLM